MIQNMYSTNHASKYTRQKLTKFIREIDKTSIITKLCFSFSNKTSSQKVSKDIEDVNNTTNQLYLIDTYTTLRLIISD